MTIYHNHYFTKNQKMQEIKCFLVKNDKFNNKKTSLLFRSVMLIKTVLKEYCLYLYIFFCKYTTSDLRPRHKMKDIYTLERKKHY